MHAFEICTFQLRFKIYGIISETLLQNHKHTLILTTLKTGYQKLSYVPMVILYAGKTKN